MPDFEVTVIGAGVIGLAIAARLSELHPNLLVAEKNERYGMETSSRNSEVIHAGIYYQPGSLKARLCTEGREELYALCGRHGIPHRKITKLITATNEEERSRIETICRNGLDNGVDLRILDKAETLKLEPNIKTVGSIFSPTTGIISAHGLMDYFYHTATANGATVQHHCSVTGIDPVSGGYALTIDEQGRRSTITTETVINAAGLFADHVAAMMGIDPDTTGYRQYFAKGSYFSVTPSKAGLVSRLIYPVPLNEGLGVHAVLDWGGGLKFGPDVEYLHDKRIDYTVAESKRAAFAASIRRILPAIKDDDISPDMSGIRPKIQKQGEPAKDFLIVHERDRGLEGVVNLVGMDSPGLTSSPAIARYVEDLLYG